MIGDTKDPEGYERALRKMPRQAARFGRAVARLLEVVKERYRLADSKLPPAEKIAHLAAAKLALAELEEAVSKARGFELYGLKSAKQEIAALEQTFRAFGYYAPSVTQGVSRALTGGAVQ